MIILIPKEYYVKVSESSFEELDIEDRYIDYDINLYRESISSGEVTKDSYKDILDLENVYKSNFFDELDNEYAKSAIKSSKEVT